MALVGVVYSDYFRQGGPDANQAIKILRDAGNKKNACCYQYYMSLFLSISFCPPLSPSIFFPSLRGMPVIVLLVLLLILEVEVVSFLFRVS